MYNIFTVLPDDTVSYDQNILELVSESKDLVYLQQKSTTARWSNIIEPSSSGREERNDNKVYVSIRELQSIYVSVQLDSIRQRSPTVIEEKDINQPTNQTKPTIWISPTNFLECEVVTSASKCNKIATKIVVSPY